MKKDIRLCFKCGKEMGRSNNRATIIGTVVTVKMKLDPVLPEDIDYYNRQLGKYSNGYGECDVATCYECYIDGLFHMGI